MSSSSKPTVLQRRLQKQNTWSASDSQREATWLRRKNSFNRLNRGQSFTDDDLDELRACFELGFGFDSTVSDPRLNSAFPALEFYNAVKNNLSRSSFLKTVRSDPDMSSTAESPGSCSFFEPGEDPDVVKTKLKQWARVVASLACNQPKPSVD